MNMWEQLKWAQRPLTVLECVYRDLINCIQWNTRSHCNDLYKAFEYMYMCFSVASGVYCNESRLDLPQGIGIQYLEISWLLDSGWRIRKYPGVLVLYLVRGLQGYSTVYLECPKQLYVCTCMYTVHVDWVFSPFCSMMKIKTHEEKFSTMNDKNIQFVTF